MSLKDRGLDEISKDIPITYVPARNTIFLSLALAWAEVLGARDIFIGVNALDYSGYPDCRPEFIEAFETMANLGTKAGVEGKKIRIHTPLINLSKAQIIKKGLELGVDFSLTSSCYDPSSDGKACGKCDACLLRLKGFAEAGIKDPAIYEFIRLKKFITPFKAKGHRQAARPSFAVFPAAISGPAGKSRSSNLTLPVL